MLKNHNNVPKNVANTILSIVIIVVSFTMVLFKSDAHYKVDDALSQKDTAMIARTQVQSVAKAMNSSSIDIPGITSSSSSVADGTPEENKKFIWDYLTTHGFADEDAAAVMGSIQIETGGYFKGHSIEGYYIQGFSSWDHDASDYEACNNYCTNFLFRKTSCNTPHYLDNGKYLEGIGVAQWTGARHRKLVEFAREKNMAWDSLELQCMFILNEISNDPYYKRGYENVKNASTVEAKADKWRTWYEGSAGHGNATAMTNARAIYNQFHD